MCDISEIKNLTCVSKNEQKRFISSFDHVMCDMDGVIWLAFIPFPGAPECIANLKKFEKTVIFVTNNTSIKIETMYEFLQKFKFPAIKENIVSPAIGYIDYLKKIKFNKLIFVIGGQGLKDELTNAGFNLAPNSSDPIEETLPSLMEVMTDNEEIGAVIIDFDINMSLIKLQKCLIYLKRKDCLFIVGTGDKTLPFPLNGPLIGNHYFYECLKECSGRTPFQMAKPSSDYNDFIVDKFSITDPKKVLFIGDSIKEDMKFAGLHGYKKLLVLTGSAKKEEVVKWNHDKDSKPEYYVESIGALNLILGMLQVK